MKRLLSLAALVVAIAPFAADAQDVTIKWSPVGNAGNAADTAIMTDGTSGYGSVAYNYQIGTHDVTNSQYVEFLNAKDSTGANALGLYNRGMSNPKFGGINYTAKNPIGKKYKVLSGRGNHPVNYVTWYSAIRFANWLNNGQDRGDTETGAYTLLGGTPTPSNGANITRNAGAKVFLPSENEWYKAAYYNPATESYFKYATSSDTAPTACPPPGAVNSANYRPSPNDPQGRLTEVGAYLATTSPYGAFDMGGNVDQWNETLFDAEYSLRGLRGGSCDRITLDLLSSYRNRGLGDVMNGGSKFTGFRVASIPFKSDLAIAGTVPLQLKTVNGDNVTDLRDRLLVVAPDQFPVVRDALLPNKDAIVESLWEVALAPKRPSNERFQAACALATYTPEDNRWQDIDALVVEHLLSRQASEFVLWRAALRPAKKQLIKPLSVVYRDTAQEKHYRIYATETLADYASDDPNVLFGLLADAEDFQFPVFGPFALNKQQAITIARKELEKQAGDQASENDKESLAKRQANAAVALYRIGDVEKIWPLLKFNPDPRVRSYFIHWLSPLGGDPQAIIQRLDSESDVSIRQALVHILGEFNETQLPSSQRQPIIEKLLTVYENEPNAGLHGAVEWLLRKWEQSGRLQAVIEKLKINEDQLRARKAEDKKQWYVNTQGQTFVIVDGGEFLMGSSHSEMGHAPDELQHHRRVNRHFAISMTEVTNGQFGRFLKEHPKVQDNMSHHLNDRVKTNSSPQTDMTWYEAAWYCNWLSEQEGISKEDWCYEPTADGKFGTGMKAKEKFWELRGYRLPTEAEWEYACRAGTITSRHDGLSEKLLSKSAQSEPNGENEAWPPERLKPNDFGLLDMLGDAGEWCFDQFLRYPTQGGGVVEDSPTTDLVQRADRRVVRGGAFYKRPLSGRSARRSGSRPGDRSNFTSFRPARTLP